MRHSFKRGLSFGLTSGVITTLGLMVGLHSGTKSEVAVIGGILTIAIADAFSDGLGMHVSQESLQDGHTSRDIWEATIATFLAKFLFALTFIIPILVFDLSTAILVNIIWGFLVLGIFSYVMAKQQRKNPWGVVIEHLVIGLLVIGITHWVGEWLAIVL